MEEMKKIIEKLNKAADTYYNNGEEIISNYEYDMLFDKLVDFENKTGIILSDSPTQKVGSNVLQSSKLKKVTHKHPALSLDKTKSIDDLKSWLGDKLGVLSWKMDGLTGVATYIDGLLVSLVTRGNGTVGEDITHNAKFIKGLPMKIAAKGEIEIRGELVMSYSEFDRINDGLEEPYKNPRNLAAGTVRALDDSIQTREVWFCGFHLVSASDEQINSINSFNKRLNVMQNLGINTVEHVLVTADELSYKIYDDFEKRISKNEFPTDGLVVEYDDILFGENLGFTGHHPRYGMAFKWMDETKDTVLRKIEWSASRTGLLNPVAVFDSIDLEGTTVSRASIHNLSYMYDMDLRIGDNISVYKANMIIPQIAENKAVRNEEKISFDNYKKVMIPSTCPICGKDTTVANPKDSYVLKCTNSDCAAKKIGKLIHFCSRDAMNLDGFAKSIITTLVEHGYVTNYADLYHLDRYPEISKMEGFGEKSYKNLLASAEKSRDTDFVAFIYSMGIPNIGKSQAKSLRNHLDEIYDASIIEDTDESYNLIGFLVSLYRKSYDFTKIDGFGNVIVNSLNAWIKNYLVEPTTEDVLDLIKIMRFTDKKPNKDMSLKGKTFVITGTLETFKNRNELVAYIESLGGKVSGSVSSKTSYLINNDVTSTSGKNKKAKELGVAILSEKDFLSML